MSTVPSLITITITLTPPHTLDIQIQIYTKSSVTYQKTAVANIVLFIPITNRSDDSIFICDKKKESYGSTTTTTTSEKDDSIIEDYESLKKEEEEKGEEDEPDLVAKVRRCLESGQGGVQLSTEGVGGTYFITDEKNRKIAVFKAQDEEPGGVNDPKRIMEVPLLPPGGGFKREILARLLDHGNHAGVPETYYLSNVSHPAFNNTDNNKSPKSGSLQKYVPNIDNAESMSSSRFLVSDVHNIGILDIRLFNMDRNLENLLVRKENDTYRLVPIDHSYTLPSTLDGACFDWLYWNQSKVPFSDENLEYIESLDIDHDAAIIRAHGIEEDCIRTMKISTLWLKNGARAGMNLYEIAQRMCRKKAGEESFLERLVKEAEQKSYEQDRPFLEVYDKMVKEVVDKIKREEQGGICEGSLAHMR